MNPWNSWWGINTTTSSASNVTVTWTKRIRNSHYSVGGWWGILDAIGHRLHLPKNVQRILCDRFELAVGIDRPTLALDYNGKIPWWLKV